MPKTHHYSEPDEVAYLNYGTIVYAKCEFTINGKFQLSECNQSAPRQSGKRTQIPHSHVKKNLINIRNLSNSFTTFINAIYVYAFACYSCSANE